MEKLEPLKEIKNIKTGKEENLKFEEFMNNFCKNGITLTNNYTGETISFRELVKKYKLTNNIKT